MSLSQKNSFYAFTLVEVVIALGIFVFCVVGVVSLISMALSSSRDSGRDSSMAAALHTLDSQMRAISATNLSALTLTGTTVYFDFYGNSVTGTATSHYYRATVQRVTASAIASATGVTNTNRYFVWKAAFSYPPPSYPTTNYLLLGRASYDP